MTNDLEKLSLGQIVKKIVSEEIYYHGVMDKIGRDGAYIKERIGMLSEITLNPLYAELDRRQGKICVCS